jgi:hypothetical protein
MNRHWQLPIGFAIRLEIFTDQGIGTEIVL